MSSFFRKVAAHVVEEIENSTKIPTECRTKSSNLMETETRLTQQYVDNRIVRSD